MRKILPTVSAAILLTACALPQGNKPSMDVNPYLTEREREVINEITFEVQKVLDTIDGFRSSRALDYVTKIDIPGWRVEKREEKIAFLTQKKFIAYKEFTLPSSCVKEIGNAEVNVCHMKLSQSLKKLGEAYNCEVKASALHLDRLREKVEVVCTY